MIAHGASCGERRQHETSPGRGARIHVGEEISFAATRLCFLTRQPTADAVGYLLKLLRS